MNHEVIRMDDRTWRIEDGPIVRFFLIAGAEKAVLLDSGMTTGNAREIAEELTDLPLMLVNTHADPDHLAGCESFDTCYMHPAEEGNFRFQGKTGNFEPLADGDVIDLGGRTLEVVHIPGHTPGSIALLDVERRVLYSGDTVQDGQIFLFGPQRDVAAYRESLKKLDAMTDRFDAIYPSHASIPVANELISKLYEVSGHLTDGTYELKDAEFHGMPVILADTGIARFMLDK